MRTIKSLNPYSQKVLFEAVFFTEDELNTLLDKSWNAFNLSKGNPLTSRLLVVENLKKILHKEKEPLATLMCQEMAKPYKEAEAEIEKCISLCDYYYKHASVFLSPRILSDDRVQARVEYVPLGIILGIMPWNFPVWQVLRMAMPAFLVGNAVLLKHAPNVPLCALKLEELFLKAGATPGAYQNLFISEAQVEFILADKRVRGVSLTGSENAGKAVASIAGRYLKKQVLELGGNDPFIVMPSAHLKDAVHWAVKSRLINNGQSCIAAKRFIIHESIYNDFIQSLKTELSALKIGDPSDVTIDIGPLARVDLVEVLKRQVDESVKQGAKIEAQFAYDKPHSFFAPITILSSIKKGMPAYHEELFGPVFSVFKVSSIEEAIALANDSLYGLGASVWSEDADEQTLCAQQLEAGSVFINAMVRSDSSLPFGGIKNSGYGRELSEEGLKEFCNVKTIVKGII